MKVREPVARPLDIVAVELLLSASQAFVVGALMYLAVGIWDDRGVGFGPVAIILGLLGLTVGGSWLYWLMGGVGWPLAAANVPTAMFLGFALILGWQGDGIVQLDALPVIFALSASVFGIVGGVFIDSPRRWRWDQRQKLRPGTAVPRVSPTTKAAVAGLQRSMPSRSATPTSPASPGSGASASKPDVATTTRAASGDIGSAYVAKVDSPAEAADLDSEPVADDDGLGEGSQDLIAEVDTPVRMATTPSSSSDAAGSTGTERPSSAVSGDPSSDDADEVGTADGSSGGGIELPTSVEPKAQRSPWAWAAPPEWSRDEDEDEPPSGSKSR